MECPVNLNELKVGQSVVSGAFFDGEEASALKKKINKASGSAIELLFNLEIELNKLHKGEGKNFDKGLGDLRKQLRSAMEALEAHKLWGFVDEMYKV
jgi:hypothetical protein